MSLPRLELDTSWGPLILEGGSRAGDATLLLLPQLSLALDPGRPHRALPPMRTVFVSHGHLDHLGGLAYWASQRLLHGMHPSTVLAPRSLCSEITELLDLHARLEGSASYGVDVLAVEAGQPRPLRRDIDVVPFATDHWIPTLGAKLVWRRRKLLPELEGLPPDEIGRRRATGEDVTREVVVPLLAYGADGSLASPAAAAAVEEAEVTLIECTFFDPEERDRAARYGHLHLDDLVSLAPHLRCRHLVVLHASRRHRIAEVRKMLDERLRPNLAGDLHDLLLDWN